MNLTLNETYELKQNFNDAKNPPHNPSNVVQKTQLINVAIPLRKEVGIHDDNNMNLMWHGIGAKKPKQIYTY